MNENIDLTKILKDCPKGWKFWSPIFGEVEFKSIFNNIVLMNVKQDEDVWSFSADATFPLGNIKSIEIMLYPSKSQRDWSKFTASWYKKDKFDPKTLKAFDKVLVFDSDRPWTPLLFSYLEYSLNYPRMLCFDFTARKVIPYNKETEHLVGTNEEAPEFYRYWED